MFTERLSPLLKAQSKGNHDNCKRGNVDDHDELLGQSILGSIYSDGQSWLGVEDVVNGVVDFFDNVGLLVPSMSVLRCQLCHRQHVFCGTLQL